MTKLLVVLLILLALLAGADIAARGFAEDAAGDAIEKELGVPHASIAIADFPFIPSVLRGQLDAVELRAPAVVQDGLRLSDVRIEMRSIRVSLSKLLGRDLAGLDVGRASGRASILESEINQALPVGTHLDIAPGATFTGTVNGVEVEGTIAVDGDSIAIDSPAGATSLALPDLAGASYRLRRTTGTSVVVGIEASAFTLDGFLR